MSASRYLSGIVPAYFLLTSLCIFPVVVDAGIGTPDNPAPFIPETQPQFDNLAEQINYRQQRINDNDAYVKMLYASLDQVKKKKKSDAQERQRSALALRIVRISSQVLIDQVRIKDLQARIDAGRANKDIATIKYEDIPYMQLRKSTMNDTNQQIARLIIRLEPDITEKNALHSLNKLKRHMQQELVPHKGDRTNEK